MKKAPPQKFAPKGKPKLSAKSAARIRKITKRALAGVGSAW